MSDVVEASKTKITKPQNDYHIKSRVKRCTKNQPSESDEDMVNSCLWQWQRPGCITRRLPWYGDSSTTCVFCEDIFPADTKWETWVKCFQFKIWAQAQCAVSVKDVCMSDDYK